MTAIALFPWLATAGIQTCSEGTIVRGPDAHI